MCGKRVNHNRSKGLFVGRNAALEVKVLKASDGFRMFLHGISLGALEYLEQVEGSLILCKAAFPTHSYIHAV